MSRSSTFPYVILVLSFSDELSSILKKLSLEKYQPIFEEQEVFNFLCQGGIPKHFPSTIKSVFFFVPILFSLLLGGHGGIPDSNRWRPEGAGH